MRLDEFHSFNLSDTVKFHNELNPAIFNQDKKMDSEVRRQLLMIAKDFVEDLGISDFEVSDVTISGSNAAYSYTKNSDLDLHILVDFNSLSDNEVYQEFFDAKKSLYNEEHDITVRGIPVELYVQDTNQPHVTLGEYSVLNNKWLKIPTKDRANFNHTTTKLKFEKLYHLLSMAYKAKDYNRLLKVLDILKRYRRAGLDTHGEFGPENLAYKALRNLGIVQDLYDLKNALHSKKLSLENITDEDYSSNSPPPDQEFSPTIPKDAISVDVSDVYDWNKLGKHISNLKGTVDPTYNVNEAEQQKQNKGFAESASGYIPSKKQAKDPRFSSALTVDIKPDSIKKNAKAFGSKISRAGIPPIARSNGKI